MRPAIPLLALAVGLVGGALVLLADPAAAESVGLVEAKLNTTFFETEPQQQVIAPLLVTSRATVPMVVRVEFLDPPAEWHAISPSPITIPPTPHGEVPRVYTLPLTVQTPFENGENNDTAQFRFRVLAASKDGGEAPTEVATFSFVIHSEGMYVPTPGAWAVLAAAGVAVATRRRLM